MKMSREHVVPLSRQARALLDRAREIRTSSQADALLFPGFTRHGALSENALLALLARAGYFGRQTARDSAPALAPGRMRYARRTRT
jgi:integrase